MTEIYDNYRILVPKDLADLTTQLNLVLGRIAQRLDEMQNLRGTPQFYNLTSGTVAGSVSGALAVKIDATEGYLILYDGIT